MSDTNESAGPLAGQVALVTGASRGIGRAIAESLARDGARVACVATRVENAEATASACSALTEGSKAYGVDVSDHEAVAALVKEVGKEFGGIDVLVNNAGITRDQLLMRMGEDDFDRVIDVNLKGTWNFVKAAARPLMKAGAGRIINIASVVGVTGNAGQANYAASKAGVIGLTKSAAKELSGRGVTVNAIAPGFIETDMTSEIPDNERNALMGGIPLGRMGAAGEIAAAVSYLAGPGGAYITGQTLVIDGGLSL
ncbi:MAG: 3-oxoacyl-[acyl-carrier-protein] reductase [Planctomycetota bacterium]|nr:3-oxoacyl-[acyl-carrier-protein] reductase [Planctomycetota bacterium]